MLARTIRMPSMGVSYDQAQAFAPSGVRSAQLTLSSHNRQSWIKSMSPTLTGNIAWST